MKMKSIVQILLAIKITGGWDETEVVFLMYIYIYIFFFFFCYGEHLTKIYCLSINIRW